MSKIPRVLTVSTDIQLYSEGVNWKISSFEINRIAILMNTEMLSVFSETRWVRKELTFTNRNIQHFANSSSLRKDAKHLEIALE